MRHSTRARIRAGLRRLATFALVAGMLAGGWVVLVRNLGMALYTIPSDSMAPAITAGQLVLTRAAASPSVGDVIVFDGTGLFPEDPVIPGDQVCKRVVAVAGDTVWAGSDGRVRVRAGEIERHLGPWNAESSEPFGPVQVQPGTVWVIGDNRDRSRDSRWLATQPTVQSSGQPTAPAPAGPGAQPGPQPRAGGIDLSRVRGAVVAAVDTSGLRGNL